MKRIRLKRKPVENNSMIIKKHNQRKLHKSVIENRIKNGYYKNPEFD